MNVHSSEIRFFCLPNVGKSTLFNALLKKQVAESANYPFTTIEPNVGVVEDLVLPDELKKAFVKNKKAAANFENFSTSLRKQILYYIYSEKQETTRKQQAEKLLSSLEANKNPFL